MYANISDKVWKGRIIEELVFKLACNFDSLVYVVNSGSMTKDNLNVIAENEIKFISRLPAMLK